MSTTLDIPDNGHVLDRQDIRGDHGILITEVTPDTSMWMNRFLLIDNTRRLGTDHLYKLLNMTRTYNDGRRNFTVDLSNEISEKVLEIVPDGITCRCLFFADDNAITIMLDNTDKDQ